MFVESRTYSIFRDGLHRVSPQKMRPNWEKGSARFRRRRTELLAGQSSLRLMDVSGLGFSSGAAS
jgi:hypothetical protein